MMEDAGGETIRMLPLWVQWLFAGRGIALIVAVFLALWAKLGQIEKRIGRLEGTEGPPGAQQGHSGTSGGQDITGR